jgi:hypothetical protein
MIATLVWALLASTTYAVPPPQPAAAPADSPPFLVAVLRRDGIVSPFAAFDGKDWKAPWPSSLRDVEIPIDRDSVPTRWWGKGGPVETMTAWIDGRRRGTLKIGHPTAFRVMCMPQLGLVSDYHATQPAPPQVVQPFPKDGLAVSGDQPVTPIEILGPTSPEWASTAALVREPFDKAEDAAIGAFTDWSHPVRRNDRHKLPIEIETLYRAPMDEAGGTAYYVEAIRRYAPGRDDEGCGLVTSAGGWVILAGDRKPTTKLAARVTYCDRRGVSYMLPLGLITASGRNYWAFQLSGYGHEAYLIAHPRPKTIMQEVFYSPADCRF